jgi:hypothetical protein
MQFIRIEMMLDFDVFSCPAKQASLMKFHQSGGQKPFLSAIFPERLENGLLAAPTGRIPPQGGAASIIQFPCDTPPLAAGSFINHDRFLSFR